MKRLEARQKVSVDANNLYVPYDVRHLRIKEKENICKTVLFTSPQVFEVSGNTLLLSVAAESVYVAIDLLKKYIGAENCFNIMQVNNYLVVLLEGEEEQLESLRNDLREVVSDAVKYREKVNRKTLKTRETIN